MTAKEHGSLEPKADRLFEYIRDYLKEEARPPSRREMAKAMGCSQETLGKLLNLLEQQGRAIYRRGRRRQFWPVDAEEGDLLTKIKA